MGSKVILGTNVPDMEFEIFGEQGDLDTENNSIELLHHILLKALYVDDYESLAEMFCAEYQRRMKEE